jgi:lysophospholipase L1-like esterase
MKIAAIGDSITYGYPMGLQYSWLFFIEKKLPSETYNFGEPGDTTQDMAVRVEDPLKVNPDIIIITGGANDAFNKMPIHRAIANIEEMAIYYLAKGIKVYLGMPIPCPEDTLVNGYLKNLRKGIQDICIKLNIISIPFHDVFLNREDLYLDGVHPTIDGYREMGKAAIKVLLEK